jgi:molecular chaperone GrpE
MNDDGPTTPEIEGPDGESGATQDPEKSSPTQSDKQEQSASEATTEEEPAERDEDEKEDTSEGTAETTDIESNSPEPEVSPDADQAPEVEALVAKLEELENTLEEFKRSNEHEHQEIRKYSVESFAENMLRVRDTLDRAVELFDWESDKQERMEAIISQFDQQFTSGEITAIKPESGEQFDYNRHEVVGREEATGIDSDEIIRVERKGFELGDRVLRLAQVVIVS